MLPSWSLRVALGTLAQISSRLRRRLRMLQRGMNRSVPCVLRSGASRVLQDCVRLRDDIDELAARALSAAATSVDQEFAHNISIRGSPSACWHNQTRTSEYNDHQQCQEESGTVRIFAIVFAARHERFAFEALICGCLPRRQRQRLP